MTDALVPDTAIVPVDEFRRRLPPNWFVRGWNAYVDVGYGSWRPPDRVLNVELWHHHGARVDLTMRSEPDWEWLTAYLLVVERVGVDIRVDADKPGF